MKNLSPVVGYTAIGLGGAAILVGSSPLFPVFFEAFLVGGLLIAVGLWILAGRDLRSLLRRAARTSRAAGAFHGARPQRRPPVDIDPLLPVRILKLAKTREGTLSVSDVAIELNVPLDHAEAGLEACVRAGNALPDYDVARGHMLYRFPEFLAREDPPIQR
ncbi:MAG: hypothetical protein NT005_06200 [Spirochaetes bacterium]|nr:hypothetical protein [Spirochaetota bacterium]